ncbi:three-Cys-motif partner protein TcmP [Rufibacter hautae]|uniref:three-Cys-motif partner protein TcmP n=1 Tax=Rufibacter hautae TaxID=2595005 RepID=UPI001681C121|nr:three-Cys-motif partner protein TcmP [Rufibacter hautae]
MAQTEPKDFFKQRRSAPEIKEEIFLKFLPVWAETLFATQSPLEKVLLVDASTGTAETAEGEMPGAAKVLKTIFGTAGGRYDLDKVMQPYFYEASKSQAALLAQAMEELYFYPDLQHKPVFLNTKENLEAFQEELAQNVPAFYFLDPFGNKFSQELWLQGVGQEKTDFMMLFEYKRLAAALGKSDDQSSLASFLGERFSRLKAYFAKTSSAAKKETFALKTFEEALQEKGLQTSRFRINVPGKDQSSHYLLFVSRSYLAHTRFKELLLPYSDVQEDGVPMLGANLKAVRLLVPEYSKYLEFSLVNLVEDLLQNAAEYNSMVLDKIYEKHNVGKNYCKANYQTAFEKLKEQGKITLLNPKTGQVVYKLTSACRIKFKPNGSV